VSLHNHPAQDSGCAANLAVAGYLVKVPDFPALGLLAHRLIAGHRHRRELRALSREAA
jgi:hypothetical protein